MSVLVAGDPSFCSRREGQTTKGSVLILSQGFICHKRSPALGNKTMSESSSLYCSHCGKPLVHVGVFGAINMNTQINLSLQTFEKNEYDKNVTVSGFLCISL